MSTHAPVNVTIHTTTRAHVNPCMSIRAHVNPCMATHAPINPCTHQPMHTSTHAPVNVPMHTSTDAHFNPCSHYPNNERALLISPKPMLTLPQNKRSTGLLLGDTGSKGAAWGIIITWLSTALTLPTSCDAGSIPIRSATWVIIITWLSTALKARRRESTADGLLMAPVGVRISPKPNTSSSPDRSRNYVPVGPPNASARPAAPLCASTLPPSVI